MDLAIFKEARERIAPYVVQTPLIRSLEFPNLSLKCENFQITNSFKPRGALNAVIQKMDTSQRLVCRSAGNFAQGMAYAGKKLQHPITVVMPVHAPKVKVERAQRLGAEVILHGTTHDEGYRKVHELVEAGKGEAVSSFDDGDVIAGQGTVALELIEQQSNIDAIFCPVGGGGLMAGCSTVIKLLCPQTKVIGVEPVGSASLHFSLKQGKRSTLEGTHTIADGLLSPCVGEKNWPLLQKNVDEVILVGDDEIIWAMRQLFQIFGIVAEPSGAISFAGYLKSQTNMENAVCVISGGNVDRQRFLQWL